jgi:hypothetical protein
MQSAVAAMSGIIFEFYFHVETQEYTSSVPFGLSQLPTLNFLTDYKNFAQISCWC